MKGAAAPRSHEEQLDPGRGPNQSSSAGTRPQRAAQRLLGGPQRKRDDKKTTLPVQLRRGVEVRWLAVRIARHVMAGLTDEQLVQLIAYGCGLYAECPQVSNPHAFIAAAIRQHSPDLPWRTAQEWQTARSRVSAVEDRTRQAALARRRHEEQTAREREACQFCDEDGWTLLDGAGAEVRCDHVPVDVDEDQALVDEDTIAPLLSREDARQAIAGTLANRELRRSLVEQAEAERAARAAPSTGTGYRPRRHRLAPAVDRQDLQRNGWFTRSRRT